MIQKLCDTTRDNIKHVLKNVQPHEWVTNSILIDIVIIVWWRSCTSSGSLAAPPRSEATLLWLQHPWVLIALSCPSPPCPGDFCSCCGANAYRDSELVVLLRSIGRRGKQGWNQQRFSGTVGVRNELPGLISFVFTAPNRKTKHDSTFPIYGSLNQRMYDQSE